jgi:acetyltransferase-like isoleucine patch superfamily enzyme
MKYFLIALNYFRYRLFFHKAAFFIIRGFPSIIGLQKISIGRNFYSNIRLRIEVFGSEKETKLNIGDNVSLGQNVHIAVNNSVEILDNVLVGSNVLITDHNHGVYSGSNQSNPNESPLSRVVNSDGSVVIGENVWIGDGVVILPNVKIGNGVIVGANSVVTKDIPSGVIAGGIPCKILKIFNHKLGFWESVV